MIKRKIISITEETLQDIVNLKLGLFEPLNGFMSSLEFHSVVDDMRLPNGHVWTIPITIDVPEIDVEAFSKVDIVDAYYNNQFVAELMVQDLYHITENDIFKIFQTKDRNHPGVKKELSRSPYRIGCKITNLNDIFLKNSLDPIIIKEKFLSNGWKTIIGFQTRNPIHNAHEYLQRLGMELCDGLFINPLVGWKKKGDFSELAINHAYNVMIKDFYPKEKVLFQQLRTQMRYAGPREAIFHALIRKNLGCTHFIIGRDHAGVGSYYGIYEAHELATKISLDNNLGIQLVLCKEPYFCKKCNMIVSEKHCNHYYSDRLEISGTIIRNELSNGNFPDERMMRKEVAKEIIKLGEKMFVGGEE